MSGTGGGSTDGYSNPTSITGVDATVNQNASVADEVAVYKSCAKCGSQEYTQKRIWHESKADYDGADE
jgi:hypothetical protein